MYKNMLIIICLLITFFIGPNASARELDATSCVANQSIDKIKLTIQFRRQSSPPRHVEKDIGSGGSGCVTIEDDGYKDNYIHTDIWDIDGKRLTCPHYKKYYGRAVKYEYTYPADFKPYDRVCS